MDTSLRRVLVPFTHPALEKPRVNRALIQGLEDMEGVTFHDLYEAYPDFDFTSQRNSNCCSTTMWSFCTIRSIGTARRR